MSLANSTSCLWQVLQHCLVKVLIHVLLANVREVISFIQYNASGYLSMYFIILRCYICSPRIETFFSGSGSKQNLCLRGPVIYYPTQGYKQVGWTVDLWAELSIAKQELLGCSLCESSAFME